MGLIQFGALLLLLGACTGLQWVKTIEDGAQLEICSGDPVKLPWYFNLSQGERVKEIEWKHQAEDGDVRVVANYKKKNFVPTADFSGRVSHGGTGALELSCATILESGNYTVLVKIVDVTNTVSELRRWATVVINACTGLQWVKTIEDGAQLEICSGDPVKLPWYFNLSQGERVKEIEWKHQAEDGDVRVVANYKKKNFVPTADFSGRVSHGGTGALELSCATILESGNYTVLVKIVDVANTVSKHGRSAAVVINDTPKTQSGLMEVSQDRKAVRDVTTNHWHVQLTCGQFSDRGHPPVDAIWKTADGEQLASSNFENGNFHLLLPNPTKGGNYSCSLPSLSPATKCLPRDSELRDDATVDVDETFARFTLLEAHQVAMQAQMDEEVAITGSKMSALESQIENETSAINARLDIATRRVHFHATLGAKISFVTGNHLQPFSNVVSNEGQAFDSTTAEFTAPMNGVYFFVGSTGPQTSEKFGNMGLMTEDVQLSETYIQQDGTYDVMGTCHATVHLSKGQKVWLECKTASTFWEGTSFTGFLVYADN